jgi:peptide/nickel transport system permease protein
MTAIGTTTTRAGTATGTLVVTAEEAAVLAKPARGQLGLFWDTFRSHRMAFMGLCVLSVIVTLCIVGPFFLSPPTDIDMKILAATPPSAAHPLGTDTIGRDVLSRLLNAGRISLQIGFLVAILSVTIGSIVGVSAGYFGGKLDTGLMWFVNVVTTIPAIPLLIAVAVLIASPDSSFGAIFRHMSEALRITIVLSLLGWMGISRIVRSQVISLREQEYVEAARALGAKAPRIMFLHILPNSISVIAVFTTLAVSHGIMAESVLSFLGVGVNPPTATWGNMLFEARDLFSILAYWWLVWFPALMIFITVLSVNFVGDGIRDAFDPKARRR